MACGRTLRHGEMVATTVLTWSWAPSGSHRAHPINVRADSCAHTLRSMYLRTNSIYIRMCVCTHTHATHALHTHPHKHTHTHTHTHKHIHTQTHTHTQAHTHTNTHTQAHTYTHTCARTHPHTLDACYWSHSASPTIHDMTSERSSALECVHCVGFVN